MRQFDTKRLASLVVIAVLVFGGCGSEEKALDPDNIMNPGKVVAL